MRALPLTALLVLVASCGGESPHRPAQAEARIDVQIDPSIAASGAMHVGANSSTPRDGYESRIFAHRASDGTLVVQVNTLHDEYWFHSRIRLRGPPGALTADAFAHPGTRCRGTIQVSHDRIADLTDAPLILRSELTNWRSGSDVTERLAIEITEADLR